MTERLAMLLVLGLAPAIPIQAAPPAQAVDAAQEENATAGAAEQEVIDTVQRLFDALASRDRDSLEALMMPEGRVLAMRGGDADGTPGSTSQADFIEALMASTGELLERMWEPTVMIEGAIAMLWAPYDFHRDGEFSHCGVDHVSLVRTENGWRIAGITYTVRRQGCEPSPLGPPQ